MSAICEAKSLISITLELHPFTNFKKNYYNEINKYGAYLNKMIFFNVSFFYLGFPLLNDRRSKKATLTLSLGVTLRAMTALPLPLSSTTETRRQVITAKRLQ